MHRFGQRRLAAIALLLSTTAGSLISLPAVAADVSHGEMAAAIRSANYPCAHVLQIDSAGVNVWIVSCNSGRFRVSRDQEGKFLVTRVD